MFATKAVDTLALAKLYTQRRATSIFTAHLPAKQIAIGPLICRYEFLSTFKRCSFMLQHISGHRHLLAVDTRSINVDLQNILTTR